MNLLSFKGDRVRKADVVITKNYLNAEKLDQLNRLVSMFLDFAELRAEQRKDLHLADWRQYIDSLWRSTSNRCCEVPAASVTSI